MNPNNNKKKLLNKQRKLLSNHLNNRLDRPLLLRCVAWIPLDF